MLPYSIEIDSQTQRFDSQLFVNSHAETWSARGTSANLTMRHAGASASHLETAMRIFFLASIVAAATPSLASAQSSSSSPVAAKAVSDTARLGTYDLEITTDDGTMVGWLSLTRANDGLKAALTAGGNHPDVKSFVREGKSYVLTGGHGEFVIVYTLAFANDSVTGSFKMSTGLQGKVAGARKQ